MESNLRLESKPERLPTMKAVIRMFALFVAVAGLASASLAPANSQIRDPHNSVTAGNPGPLVILPGPLPCSSVNLCYAPSASSH
jgi:hypothetical protein